MSHTEVRFCLIGIREPRNALPTPIKISQYFLETLITSADIGQENLVKAVAHVGVGFLAVRLDVRLDVRPAALLPFLFLHPLVVVSVNVDNWAYIDGEIEGLEYGVYSHVGPFEDTRKRLDALTGRVCIGVLAIDAKQSACEQLANVPQVMQLLVHTFLHEGLLGKGFLNLLVQRERLDVQDRTISG
jgi:hypothetical protein